MKVAWSRGGEGVMDGFKDSIRPHRGGDREEGIIKT